MISRDVLGSLTRKYSTFNRYSGPNSSTTLRVPAEFKWLGDQDSNLGWRSQSPQSYRWPIPHKTIVQFKRALGHQSLNGKLAAVSYPN